jgi:hypothetical protein
MNELNNLIDKIFYDNVKEIRTVLSVNLMKDCIDMVVKGIFKQMPEELHEQINGKIDREKLYDYVLNILDKNNNHECKKTKIEKLRNMELAVNIVINAMDELIAEGDLRVEGVLDKNKLFEISMQNEVL